MPTLCQPPEPAIAPRRNISETVSTETTRLSLAGSTQHWRLARSVPVRDTSIYSSCTHFALDRLLCGVCPREKREIHFRVVYKAVAVGRARYPQDVVAAERNSEVVGAVVPCSIDYEIVPIDALRVSHRMSGDPSVDRVALSVGVESGQPQSQVDSIVEATPGCTHPNTPAKRAIRTRGRASR